MVLDFYLHKMQTVRRAINLLSSFHICHRLCPRIQNSASFHQTQSTTKHSTRCSTSVVIIININNIIILLLQMSMI